MSKKIKPSKVAKKVKKAVERDRFKRITDAELVCAEAYQVVGSLLDDLGAFESECADKILDNLASAKMLHTDVLPWNKIQYIPEGYAGVSHVSSNTSVVVNFETEAQAAAFAQALAAASDSRAAEKTG